MDFGYFIVIEVMVILHISASEKILASQYFDPKIRKQSQ